MSQYTINIGAIPNDGTGDPLRTAFNETNLNFNQVWATGLVNSNVQIANNTILTTNTNGNLVLAPNGIGLIQSNVSIVPNTANIRNLGSATQRWATVYAQYLNATQINLSGDLSVTGNLTVSGNIIQLGNIVTDSLTIQLANTASNTSAANGSGITVGASDDIATILYNSTDNTWTTNIGISSVGNITAPYFIGNGSQLTGLPAGYANANAVAYGESGWAGNIIPSGNAVYSLGNSTNQWSDLYVSNATIYMNNVPVSLTSGNVLTVNGQAVLSNDSNATITTTGNITADYFIGDGSLLTGISGGANTGNVTFSDNTVIGTGDQYGYSGLFLAPGPNSVGNLQYLQVRGGDNPTHIHFDTGNNAYYDQYFGNDNKFVKLEAGATGNIVIGTDDNVGNLYNWTFDATGNLNFPDNSGAGWPVNTQRFGMGNIGAWLDGQWTIGEFSGDGVSGTVGIRIDPAIEGPVGMTFPSSASSNTQPVQIYSTNGSGIQLYTGGNNWTFNDNGTTTFPDNTIQPLAGNNITLSGGAVSALPVGSLVFDGADKLNMSPGFTISTGAYTVESFVYVTNVDTRMAIVSCSTPGSGGFTFDLLSSNQINVDSDGMSGLTYSFATPIQFNAWNHIAVTRNGINEQTVFLNGIRATEGVTAGVDYAGTTDAVGDFNVGSWVLTGSLSQIRAVVGTNVYDPNSATITVPTTALTDVSGTQLLLDVETAGTYLTDSSGTQTITNTGVTFSSAGPAVTYSGASGNANVVAGNYNWQFNNTGSTIFPTLTVDLHNGGNQSGQTLQFGNVGQQAFITGPTPAVNTNAERLIIQGQRGLGTGEGGDVYVWGGDSDVNGGDIKIYAGDADTVGRGGNIHVAGGRGTTNAGEITLTGGQNDDGVGAYVGLTGGRGSSTGGAVSLNGGYGDVNGGDINIIGGIGGNGLGSYGNVNIATGASTWTFDNTGILSLPPTGVIVEPTTQNLLNLNRANAVHLRTFGPNDIQLSTDWDGAGGSWTFGADGELTLPGATAGETVATQDGYITVGNLLVGQGGSLFNSNNDTWALYGNTSDPDATITIPSNAAAANGTPLSLQVSSNIEIISGGGTWNFDSTGNLNVPQGGWIGAAGVKGDGTMLTGGTGQIASLTSFYADAPGIYAGCFTANPDGTLNITTYGNGTGIDGQWIFSGANLTVPGEGIIQSVNDTVILQSLNTTTGNANSVYLGTSGGLGFQDQAIGGNWLEIFRLGIDPQLATTGNLLIRTDSSNTAPAWTFDNTGNLTVPGNLNGSGASPAPSINGFDSINSVSVSASGNITGGNISTTGTGGDITLTGGNITGVISITTTPVPLANLTAVAGGRAFVNNGNLVAAGNFGAQIGSGGSNVVPVWSDGTNWYVG